jgi:hypothetical protein
VRILEDLGLSFYGCLFQRFGGKSGGRLRIPEAEKRLSRNTGSEFVRAGVDSKSVDNGARWRRCAVVGMVAKGNCRCLACTPLLAKPAHTGDLVIVRDDSGARQWIEEIGKIGTERESMRDITLNVKCGQILFTQWFIRTIGAASACEIVRTMRLGPEAKPTGRASLCTDGLDDIDRRKAFAQSAGLSTFTEICRCFPP